MVCHKKEVEIKITKFAHFIHFSKRRESFLSLMKTIKNWYGASMLLILASIEINNDIEVLQSYSDNLLNNSVSLVTSCVVDFHGQGQEILCGVLLAKINYYSLSCILRLISRRNLASLNNDVICWITLFVPRPQ